MVRGKRSMPLKTFSEGLLGFVGSSVLRALTTSTVFLTPSPSLLSLLLAP